MRKQGDVQSLECRLTAVLRARGISSPSGYPRCEQKQRPTKQQAFIS